MTDQVKGFYESSRQLQHRRVNYDIPKIQADNRGKGRVHVPAWWFEVDAYGAAVEGIIMSIDHALGSGSIGSGAEEETLKHLRKELLLRDSGLAKE